MKLTRISDEKIKLKLVGLAIMCQPNKPNTPQRLRSIAQAQLEADQEGVREIFEELDVQMPKKHYEDESIHHAPKECKLCWYQALKQKHLKEDI